MEWSHKPRSKESPIFKINNKTGSQPAGQHIIWYECPHKSECSLYIECSAASKGKQMGMNTLRNTNL
jgi:hypothetical protein